jgi:hypothetical protein
MNCVLLFVTAIICTLKGKDAFDVPFAAFKSGYYAVNMTLGTPSIQRVYLCVDFSKEGITVADIDYNGLVGKYNASASSTWHYNTTSKRADDVAELPTLNGTMSTRWDLNIITNGNVSQDFLDQPYSGFLGRNMDLTQIHMYTLVLNRSKTYDNSNTPGMLTLGGYNRKYCKEYTACGKSKTIAACNVPIVNVGNVSAATYTDNSGKTSYTALIDSTISDIVVPPAMFYDIINAYGAKPSGDGYVADCSQDYGDFSFSILDAKTNAILHQSITFRDLTFSIYNYDCPLHIRMMNSTYQRCNADFVFGLPYFYGQCFAYDYLNGDISIAERNDTIVEIPNPPMISKSTTPATLMTTTTSGARGRL